MSRTHLAHHELESVVVVVIIHKFVEFVHITHVANDKYGISMAPTDEQTKSALIV